MKDYREAAAQALVSPLLRRYSIWHTITACCFCCAVLTLAAFIMGFFLFVESSRRVELPPQTAEIDGIIVLTGGRARVETGLQLLRQRQGARLLISGVSPIVGDRQNFAQILGIDQNLLECCVDLGREALNTVGNADESAAWVEKHGYNRVLIVTNRYHMLRSMAELRRKMPETELIPYPVESAGGLWQSVGNFRLFASEYSKFLVVSGRNFAAQLW